MSTSDDQTINLPQLFLVVFLGCIALRYFFFSSDSPPLAGQASSSSSSSSARRAREADVERIQQMFPQVARRSIMWDLQRNGGNVVATTERILSGRGLEVPPQSFQPLPAPSSNTPSSSNSSTTTKSKSKPLQPDLITRYNLQNRLLSTENDTNTDPSSPPAQQQEQHQPPSPSPSPARPSPSSTPRGKSWSTNKTERQALLQKRRDEMILAARRKMEERLAREGAAAAAGAGAGAR